MPIFIADCPPFFGGQPVRNQQCCYSAYITKVGYFPPFLFSINFKSHKNKGVVLHKGGVIHKGAVYINKYLLVN